MNDTKEVPKLKELTKDDVNKIIAEAQSLVEQYKAELFKQQGIVAGYQYLLNNYKLADAVKPPLEVK
jgi:ferritin-like metal-binding protein YciE